MLGKIGGALIGALRVNLGLDSAQFVNGTKRAKAEMGSFSTLAKASFAAIGTAAVGAAGTLAVMVQNSINVADEMGKAAQSIGVTVEELSRLKYAAELSDISFESLQTAIARLSRNMADASRGVGTGRVAFEQLGIAVTNSDGSMRTATQVMTDVAARFAAMDNGAQKTALAMQLFGRAGADLIPMLNAGAGGLREATEEADRLGITIGTETARNAEIFNDNLTRMTTALSGAAMGIANQILPALASFSEWLVTNQQALSNFIGNVIARMTQSLQVALSVVNSVRSAFNSFREGLQARGVDTGLRFGLPSASSNPFAGAIESARAAQAASEQLSFSLRDIGSAGASGGGRAAAGLREVADTAKEAAEAAQEAADRITQKQREMDADAKEAARDAAAEIEAATDKLNAPLERIAEKSAEAKGQVVQSFQEMADGVIGAMQRLANGISGGGFLGILQGVIGLGMQLGSVGVFGTNIAKSINNPVPAGSIGELFGVGPRMASPGQAPQGAGAIAINVMPSPYFNVAVDGRIAAATPALSGAASLTTQRSMSRSALRQVG